MPSTITTQPTYPVPNREARVIITPADGATNFIRLWCTVAPPGSELDGRIKKISPVGSTPKRVLVYEGQPGATHPWRHTFDKGGAYTFALQSYARGSGFGGGYLGDPRGAPTETQLGIEETLSAYLGDRLTQQVGFGGDTATLAIWSWDSTIRATFAKVHGETSPALIEPTSPRAVMACGDSLVKVAVATLRNLTFTGLLSAGGLAQTVSLLRADFDDHLDEDGKHAANDTNNAVGPEFSASVSSPESLVEALSTLMLRMRNHFLNDANGDGDLYGPGTAAYHEVSGEERSDYTNLPIVGGVTPENAVAAVGDLCRALRAHVMDTTVHLATDPEHDPPTSFLVNVHQEFSRALVAATPVAAPGQGSLAAQLGSWGFETE